MGWIDLVLAKSRLVVLVDFLKQIVYLNINTRTCSIHQSIECFNVRRIRRIESHCSHKVSIILWIVITLVQVGVYKGHWGIEDIAKVEEAWIRAKTDWLILCQQKLLGVHLLTLGRGETQTVWFAWWICSVDRLCKLFSNGEHWYFELHLVHCHVESRCAKCANDSNLSVTVVLRAGKG